MVSEPSKASTTPTDTPQTFHITTTHTTTQPQSPLLSLSDMSNLMSIKLDYTNYIPWKHRLITILEAYSLIEHIDDSTSQPCQFLLDAQGNLTTSVNPYFLPWRIIDKALLSLINSTLNSTGFLTQYCWNHKLKRSLEHFRAEVYFNFKSKYLESDQAWVTKSQEREWICE